MKLFYGLVLIAWMGSSFAAEKAPEPISFIASAKVMIDDQGVPQQVQPHEKLPAVIKDAIEQRVKAWRFEPARIDGVAKSGVTYVYLTTCAVTSPGKGMALSMNYLSNGPGYADGHLRMPAPRYPTEAARNGNEGSFRVVTQISAEGRASIESIETEKGNLKRFEKSLKEWMKSIRFLPEEVDGAPIATRMGVPVDFFLEDGESSGSKRLKEAKRSPECMAATGQTIDPTQPVVLDSPFKPRSTS